MARNHPKAYPPDFRQKVVELARSGRQPDDLAHEFDLARQTVRNWIKQADLDSGRRNDGLSSEERTELFKLRKQVKQLTIEREILSKAYLLQCDEILALTHVKSATWPSQSPSARVELHGAILAGKTDALPDMLTPVVLIIAEELDADRCRRGLPQIDSHGRLFRRHRSCAEQHDF